jgi:anaerobic selenocysteine-containing dehydrogenase
VQASGPQAVSVEDSTSCIHGSRGKAKPASPHLLSEPAIVAGIAKQILAAQPEARLGCLGRRLCAIRDAIEQTYPEVFKDYQRAAVHPRWLLEGQQGGRADLADAEQEGRILRAADTLGDRLRRCRGRFRLMTLRSNDQFNTTIYGYHDRFRGVKGTRDVLFMHESDMAGSWSGCRADRRAGERCRDGKRRRRDRD